MTTDDFKKARDERGGEVSAEGTYNCPICAWPTPHSHTAQEIAERPHIDGCREAFEHDGRQFMAEIKYRELKDLRSGYFWGMEGERARNADEKSGFGWALRTSPTGAYHHAFTQLMWEFWREAWLFSARQALKGGA